MWKLSSDTQMRISLIMSYVTVDEFHEDVISAEDYVRHDPERLAEIIIRLIELSSNRKKAYGRQSC